jgi:hypothetical protein
MLILCDKIINRNKFKPHRKLFGNYNYSSFDDISNVPIEDWGKALNQANLFLSHSYLSILHRQETNLFRFRYVIVYNRLKPIGVVYFQINDFNASSFGEIISEQIKDLTNRKASVFQNYISGSADDTVMRLVTCGNNYISGEHGFYLQVNHRKTKFKLLESIINHVSREEKLRGKISAILVKDFYEEGFGDKDCWYCTRFKHFYVEPNMIINLPNHLESINDYIGLFSKKYRNRAKTIFKASDVLVKKRLSAEELKEYCTDIYQLYLQVFNQAKFKLVKLPEYYFYDVMSSFPKSFYIDAWFLNGKMVSFASGYCLPHEVEAHYIGFDYSINKEYELYQTILYSYIEQAIETKKSRINLGRTASEIKTTVGAKVHELICYIKPQNTVSKLILKPFMHYLQPSEWIPRNPFKED